MKSPWRVFLAAWVIILAGAFIAHLTQTAGGITIKELTRSTRAAKRSSGKASTVR